MKQRTAEFNPDAKDATSKAGVLQEAKQAVATIIDIPTLKDALNAIKEGMNANQVKSYAEALADVAEQLTEINRLGADVGKITPGFAGGAPTITESKSPAMTALENIGGSSTTEISTLLEGILTELQNQTPSIRKTAKETGSNVANSVIPISN